MSRSTLTLKQRTEKWQPLLRGLDRSQHNVIAWVIEEEIRYLQKVMENKKDNGDLLKIQALKVIVPSLRRALEELVPASAVDRLASIAVWPNGLTIERVRAALDDAVLTIQPHVEWSATTADIAFLTCPLSERTYEALLTYPWNT